MKTKTYLNIVILIILACAALASAALLEKEQTSGGEAYYFYYADQSNTVDKHRFAMQTFKVSSIGEITKLSLRLKVIDTMNVCWGNSEKFDLQIRNSKDSVIASKNDLPLCGLSFNSFGWQDISFSSPVAVMPGESYKIVVLYRGYALKNNAALSWERSTSDVYTDGKSTDGNFVESSKDFTFKVYGNKAVLCDSGWYCKDGSGLDYKNSDCSWANTPKACGSDSYCDTNKNSCEKKVDVGIKEIEIYDDLGLASSFDPEEQITYQILARDNGGVGKFNAYFKIYDASQKIVDSTSFLDQTVDSKGLVGSLKTLNFISKIGSGWQGSYTFEAKVEPCLGTESCTSTKSFSVKAVCPDSDKDGVTICQNDCNDNDEAVNQKISCAYDGNSCGNSLLCVASCPQPPQEILCDGIDNDCDANTKDDACDGGLVCDFGEEGVCGCL
ncbi:MAG: hypothetical protein ABIA37_04660 [Candidatus Woesearchaeota archaeon]